MDRPAADLLLEYANQSYSFKLLYVIAECSHDPTKTLMEVYWTCNRHAYQFARTSSYIDLSRDRALHHGATLPRISNKTI